jgi:hypothetical protein
MTYKTPYKAHTEQHERYKTPHKVHTEQHERYKTPHKVHTEQHERYKKTNISLLNTNLHTTFVFCL